MSTKRALIFANGSLPDVQALRRLMSPEDQLLAADGGTHHLLALGCVPSVVIGDLDSLTESERLKMEGQGVSIFEYPRDKDETDLEIALHYAVEQGFDPILIVAALGGRLDQILGNLSLLTQPSLAGHDIRLDDGVEEVLFTRDHALLSGKPGDLVSLIAWGGDVTGVRTQGLKWPLQKEDLIPHKTRGISNVLLENTARIRIDSGLLLIVHRRLA